MTSPTGMEEASPSPELPMVFFGATCAPLAEQLAPYELGSLCIPHAQADADAITRLYVRGYISQKVKDAAQDRLVREMKRAMKTPRKGSPNV